MGAVIDPVQLVQPALAQGSFPGVVSWPDLPTRPHVLPVPKVARVYRFVSSHRGVRELLLYAALTGQSSFTAHCQGSPLYRALTVDDAHRPPNGAPMGVIPSVTPSQGPLFLAAAVQAAVRALGVLPVGSSVAAVVRTVAVAAVGEARGGALALQTDVLARGEVVAHVVALLGVPPPLSLRRARPPTLLEAQMLAHAVQAVRLLLGHLRDAVETLAAERPLLHHFPLEIPTVSLFS